MVFLNQPSAHRRIAQLAAALSLLALPTILLFGQNPLSVSKPEKDNSVEAQLESFTIDPRLEIKLFADETMGISNPICFRWDAHGRLWVLCTWAYPQLKPGEPPNDKILILEDTNADGHADKIITYADGLNMPTGFALGHGGAYIGNSRDLIHVHDTDDDDRADAREIIFTGFGTGDTHQNINSFAWSPGGELYFSQGLHCFSRVQTPWGIRRLDEHGSWRLRPLRRQLHAHRRTSGGGNPWGFAFGDWGEPFIKSNDNTISELLPGLVSTEYISGGYWGGAMQIGGTKIKSMIIEIVDSPHMPDDFQGDFIIAGYFARNVARLRPSVDGAGHKLETLEPILTSSHNAFRPVDASIGPDGSLYIADWFNPIIGHYQASFRHPDRDKDHGRIWRITAKGRPLAKVPQLAKMNASQLAEQLAAPRRWTRRQAKLRLMDLPKADATAATQKWIDGLKPSDPDLEHKLYEAIGVFESHEVINRRLLDRLLDAKDYRARAYATRVAGRWHDRLDDPLAILGRRARDKHIRVRLEAVVAASDVRQPKSILVAAHAGANDSDRFVKFAFNQTVHALANHWRPALLSGDLTFANTDHLQAVLKVYGGNDVSGVVRQQIDNPKLPVKQRQALFALLAQTGNTTDAQLILKSANTLPDVLDALSESVQKRNLQPPPNAEKQLFAATRNRNGLVRAKAIQLAGLWKINSFKDYIITEATDQNEPANVRLAATEALAQLGGDKAIESLDRLAVLTEPASVRAAAISGLAKLDLPKAAKHSAELLTKVNEIELGTILAAILKRNEGADALAGALNQAKVSPDRAKLIRRWLNAAGRSDNRLIAAVDRALGQQVAMPTYSPELVATLAREALERGDVVNGRKVFQLPLASCTACHSVDGIKGATTTVKGPNLTAVAAGLPLDLLVESVLWPDRQIKEGYEASTVVTKDGQVFSGFLHNADKNELSIRDLTTDKIITVQTRNIQQHTKGGTVMPPGLTATLTHTELLDLIKYLSTLKTTGQPK